MGRWLGFPRSFSAALVMVSLAGLLVGLPPTAVPAAAAETGVRETPIPSSPLTDVRRPITEPERATVQVPVWPGAGTATAVFAAGEASLSTSALSGLSADSVLAARVAPGGLAVTVGVPSSGSASVQDNEQRLMRGLAELPGVSTSGLTGVDVSTLDRAATAELGVQGVAFTVAPSALAASSMSDLAASSAPAEISVDYSGFAGAFGGGYADRLRLVALPGCAATTPQVPACQVQTPIAGGVNDKGAATVSAPVDFAARSAEAVTASLPATMDAASTPSSADGGVMVLAVTGATSSEQGDWAATSLRQVQDWQAGGSAGGFSYSVPIAVPPAPGGLTPSVSFGYSSQATDGLTRSTSTQASWIGEGWNYEPGFVERSYRPCRVDGQATNQGDLCWVGQSPVSITLEGVSTRLLLNNDGVWKAEDDSAGWKVEHLIGLGAGGTGLANGARDGEAFKVTTRDGTQYWFGSQNRAAAGGVLSVEVFGNEVGEPCYVSSGFAYSHCPMPYRWNLDRVVDINGNTIEYHWGVFQGSYGGNNGANVWVYDVYGWPTEIVYGANTVTGSGHTGIVTFEAGFRCFETSGVCDDAVGVGRPYWLDTPWDLYCYTWATSCGSHAPTFFSIYRLLGVKTWVWNTANGNWGSPVENFQTTQGFPSTGDYIAPAGDDSSPSLWMSALWREGYSTPMQFNGLRLDNRVDYGTGKPPMSHYRVDAINTWEGGAIALGYNADYTDHRDCRPADLAGIVQDKNTRRCFPQNDAGTLSLSAQRIDYQR